MIQNIKDCDKAIINMFRGLYVLDENKKKKEVPVEFISPQKEYGLPDPESPLPCIVVFRNGIYPDVYGWKYDNSTYLVDVEYDKQGKPYKANEVRGTEPYNIYYGVRLFYKYKEDGADLNFFITKLLKRDSYVNINGEGYDLEFLSYRNPEGTYRTFGQSSEKNIKQFVDQYLFKLCADILLDDSKKEVKLSKGVGFNINASKEE